MYVVDTNVLIAAKNLYYGFDFVPGFWDWLDQQFAIGSLCSVERVLTELDTGDELAGWAKARRRRFETTSEPMVESLRAVTQWAIAEKYTTAALQKFSDSADLHIIAFAHAHNHIVVTHEKPEPNKKGKVKIPDVCRAFEVEQIGPFEMMRRERARLVLGKD